MTTPHNRTSTAYDMSLFDTSKRKEQQTPEKKPELWAQPAQPRVHRAHPVTDIFHKIRLGEGIIYFLPIPAAIPEVHFRTSSDWCRRHPFWKYSS